MIKEEEIIIMIKAVAEDLRRLRTDLGYNQLWSVREVANHWKCCEQTVRNRTKEGVLPYHSRIGRNYRYEPEIAKALKP